MVQTLEINSAVKNNVIDIYVLMCKKLQDTLSTKKKKRNPKTMYT